MRAVLFDFDGTLVTSSIDFDAMRRSTLALIAEFGVDARPLAALPSLEALARAGAALPPEQAVTLARRAEELLREIELEAAGRAAPFPGVAGLLARLAARGLGVGIVTRNCRPAVERVLAAAPLAYDVLLTRDDTPHVKPDPRHLLAALGALGAAPAEAVMCGDHPMDVLAGRQAGTRTVGVLGPGGLAPAFAEVMPDLLVRSVVELGRHLGLDDAAGPRP
jgi:phosphoglycolate phosphatase